MVTGRLSTVISLVVVTVLLAGLVPFAGGVVAQDDGMDYQAFLPIFMLPPASPTPSTLGTIQVFDADGQEQDLDWLAAKYGDFQIQPAADGEGPVYRISALRERVDGNILMVRVVDSSGSSLTGVSVAWYWPDAPDDDDCGPAGGLLSGMVPDRCEGSPTNAGGDAGFYMGGGAYYRPDLEQIGPHAVWAYGAGTRSDLILGLGMVDGTAYDHFDVEFTRYDDTPSQPPPTPSPTPPTPEPPPPDSITVYDWQGNQRDLAYLQGKYGNFIIQPAATGGGPVYKITLLRERVETYAAIEVRVSSQDGTILPGTEVAFYWPDAPADADCGPAGGVLPRMVPDRCIHALTKVDGAIGFGMGTGAYYWPDKGEIGPHAAWVYGAGTRSDLILGLGMVAATNHNHFDVEFTRY